MSEELFRFSRQAKAMVRVKAEMKADTSMAAVKSALKSLLRALKIPGIPPNAVSLIQETVMTLRQLEPVGASEEKAMTVKESLVSIAKRQTDMDARLARTDQLLVRVLEAGIMKELPSPRELTAQAVQKAMRRIDVDVQGAHEDAVTADLRHGFEKELARGKRR